MKKSITIGGIILGSLLIAVLIIFIFFPGYPAYYKLKRDYSNMDKHINEFEKVSVPEDFVSRDAKGISVKVPADWEASGSKALHSPDGTSMLAIFKTDYSADKEKLIGEENDPWNDYKFSKEEYEALLQKLDIEVPEYDLSTRLLWIAKDKIELKDCKKLSGKDLDVFKDLAEMKESSWDTENSWVITSDNYTAYIGQILDDVNGANMWTATFYRSDIPYRYYAALRCPDDTTAKQIISSMVLSDKETE